MYYIYVIHNQMAGKFYIGQTKDLARRLEYHKKRIFKNSYTARFAGKWELVYKEECHDRRSALQRERALKSFRGREFIKHSILSA